MSDTPFKRTHCPNCHSENDLVLRNKMWDCGVEFNDPSWRTKECYKRSLAAVTKERDALRVHCTIADQTLDEMYGLTTRLGEALARINRLEKAGDALFGLLNDSDPSVPLMEWMKKANEVEARWTQAKEAR